ncbi:helicase associated domain-containing protein [Streptomyces sp. NPDC060322]|uniref:helicase associated domain-containing protein n=1 Tax=Streptomyces sp. NPDC060322 TaxID=3347097 RepID=UPI0036558763
MALDRPVGQWLSNLRRAGALAGHPEWKTALEAVDEHWNPAWPAEWQRHYAVLRELLTDEKGHSDVLPGFTVHGMDVGMWPARQRQHTVWVGLIEEQRELLEAVGVVPLPPEQAEPEKAPRKAVSAFEKGVAALEEQCTVREGSVRVPRAHVERLEDGSEVKLGVFLSNKSRRDKLTADKLQALAALGLEWASTKA